MIGTVRAALNDRDVLLFLADASREVTKQDVEAVDVLRHTSSPVVLVLNKIDLVKQKPQLLEPLERHRALYDFAEFVPVSAATGENLDELRNVLIARLPEGPIYFPADHVTDQPERFLAAELVREQILLQTRQEVPHAVAVLVDKWEETGRLVRIYATVYVEKEGQKGIIIGAGGGKLKQIGTLAREGMERFFGKKIFLDLHVEVQPEWREQTAFLDALDWRTMAGKDEA